MADRNYHRSIDLRSLWVFRTLWGLYLCYDVLISRLWPWNSIYWYTKQGGFLETNDTPHGNVIHQIWFARTSVELQYLLFGITFVLSMGLSLGKLSPSLRILLWLLVVSMQHRCMHVHDGSDNFTRQMLLWFLLLPEHVHAQLDGKKLFFGNPSGSKSSSSSSPQVSNWATTGLLLQITLMYLGTVAHRTLDLGGVFVGDWMPPKLSAVWFVIRDSFAIRDYWLVDWMRQQPFELTQLMTSHAMLAEVSPLLWFFLPNNTRLREGGFWLLGTLHLGLLLVTRLPNWQTVGMIASVLWIPTASWDAWTKTKQLVDTPDKNDPNHPKKTDQTTADIDNDDNDPKSNVHGESTLAVGAKTTTGEGSSWLRQFVTAFFFIYMIYNFCGERQWISKHDGGDVGELLRISQYWVMYASPPKTSCVTHLVGLRKGALNNSEGDDVSSQEQQQHEWIDAFQVFQRGVAERDWDWQLGRGPPADDMVAITSGKRHFLLTTFVSKRWERAFSQWGNSRDRRRARHFLQSLCQSYPSVDAWKLTWRYFKIVKPGQPGRWENTTTNSRDKKSNDVTIQIACPR